MRSRSLSYGLRKLRIGLLLRCPECERGRLFSGLFRMHETCAYCGCRFQRAPGDVIAALYINVALAEMTAVGGYVLVDAVFAPPTIQQLIFWIPCALLLFALFYRHARGLWVGVIHLRAGLYPDPDYERQYFRAQHVTPGRTPQEHE
jgi:uncharacterized protein (DUF983 family)